MENIFETYRQNQAAKGLRFHSARAGRIDARPRNVVRDPTTGARVGVTRRDGSLIRMSPQMGQPQPARGFMQTRAGRVAAAMADGSFGQKREAYNQNATRSFMDDQGDIHEVADPKPQIAGAPGGDSKLFSAYGNGSAKAGPRTHAATIEGKSAQDWFADKAKAQGRDNLYATADGRPRQSTPPKTDFGALAADKPQTLSMPAEALFPTQPKPLDKSLPATPAAPPNFGNDKALAALSPDSGRSTMAMSPASLFPGASLPATPAATPAATHAVANAVEKKPKKDPKEGVPATGA